MATGWTQDIGGTEAQQHYHVSICLRRRALVDPQLAHEDKERMIMPPEDNDHRWMLEMADRG